MSPHFTPTERSLWLNVPTPSTAPLQKDEQADVCIVGGGIAGLLIAERLSSEGLSVVVVEMHAFGSGETGRTTAHFTAALDDRFSELIRLFGDEGARLAAQSHTAAIDYAEALIARLGIDCAWRRVDGFLIGNEKHFADQESQMRDELAAARSAGLDVSHVPSLPPSWPADLGPALRFSRQAQLHPMLLLQGLVRELQSRGVHLYSGTRVTGIKGGATPAVETEHNTRVTARYVVVATNTPIHTTVSMHTKQAGYQTYVSGFELPPGAIEPALVWDGPWGQDHAYRYIRVDDSGDIPILIVGGEDHKTGQGPAGDDPHARLEEWTRRHFPMCGPAAYRWSGEVMEPADALAYIGRTPHSENVYLVTGDSGNGMTHGTISGMLIPDLILGREHPWAKLYDPSRKAGLFSLPSYVRENVNTAAQYADWIRGGSVGDESEIPPGQGAVLTHHLKHIAVYKDEHGHCTRLSAVCPHLGGIVRWNHEARTWDCPCHASRFDAYGGVLHGPANSNLRVLGHEETPANAAASPPIPNAGATA